MFDVHHQPNFNSGFPESSLLGYNCRSDNCHGTICPGNICSGNIHPTSMNNELTEARRKKNHVIQRDIFTKGGWVAGEKLTFFSF